MTVWLSNTNVFFSLLSLFSVVSSQQDCSIGPCFPSSTEVESKFVVNASSTCGVDGEEKYCLPSVQECNEICDSSGNKHPASYVNDKMSLKTFWKSVNVIRPVYLEVDFGTTLMLYRSVVTFQYEVPAAMYFTKSINYGKTYKPFNYHATSCSKFFSMSESQSNRRNGLAVECFLIDKQNIPSKQIEYGPMRDPDAANAIKQSHQNQTFFLMTNIRLVLDSYIAPEKFNISTATTALKQSLFFSIKDWLISAACFCNGQASSCKADGIQCECKRNTAGKNCEKCLPLFNNKPYQIRKACEGCGCNNHAVSCVYNATKGYGVCNNCTDNTTGDKCELCKVEHYRNSVVLKNHTNTCLPCGCNLHGVPNISNRTHCHPTTGQCNCKSRVEGRACDTCQPTFWNLKDSNSLGCEECQCSAVGTINASQLCSTVNQGQCLCKANVGERTCNKCKDGFYNLTVSNPQGCLSCGCNAAGSVNVTCNSTGGCYCRPKFYGLKCENIETGYYAPGVGSLTFEAEHGSLAPAQEMKLNHSMLTLPGGKEALFVGVVVGESSNVTTPTRLTLTVTIPKTTFYTLAMRYMTLNNWYLLKMTLELRTIFTPFSCDGGTTTISRNDPHAFLANASSADEAVKFGNGICLREGTYTLVLELQPGSSGGQPNATITIDSVVVLPTITKQPLYQFSSVEMRSNATSYYDKATSFRQWAAQSSQQGCKALSGYYGYLYGEGKGCSCNATGANSPLVCNQCGGQCACKPNVIGRTCDSCRPDYYNYTSGYGCQDCSCHTMGSYRSSCHATTGQCDCKANVINRQCSQCKPNYYSLNSGNGCSPCNCTSEYSQNLQCSDVGVCPCKPGVGGNKCTHCKDEFYRLTTSGCTVCKCDRSGSHSRTCNKTTGQCPCKQHSIERQCNTCPSGYYGLGSPHPQGCLQCQCSSKTNNCTTADDWVETLAETELLTTADNTNMDGWTAINKVGLTVNAYWEFSRGLSLGLSPTLTMGFIRVLVSEETYFKAPSKYVKQGRFAYTYTMTFKLQQDDNSSLENSTKGDVILKGTGFNQPIVYRLPSPPGTKFTGYTIKFVESDWYVGTTEGRRPTSTEMVAVLSTLQYLHIRAKWTTFNDKTTRIADIKMTYSKKANSGTKAFNVETCHCPKEYKGQFCEVCAPGYTRATPNGDAYVQCVPCQCNGHSNTCDRESGVCTDCQHNTTGNHCELCADGLYGNATHGTANDCKPCPCPGGPSSSNQFSPTCVLDSDGQPTCNNCTLGHVGRRCEICKTGYYGKPTESNGRCRKCNCNGNVDTNQPGNCNTTTGHCYNCSYNTTGDNCESCDDGFYGNALNRTCSSCRCNPTGTRSGSFCNRVSGKCECQTRVVGWSCDRCEPNAYNFTSGSGCSACNCQPQGSTKLQCNETTGICDCKANVLGNKCDSCKRGFYGVRLSSSCQTCNCSTIYTYNNTVCDVSTGQCNCTYSRGGARYGGRQCDRCETHSVGEPDNCRSCKEPCYFNWYNLIKVEKEKVLVLEKNVTDMLEAFGGSSVTVDSINKTLQELNNNLTYADNVFKGAQYDTKEKQDQINRIKDTITNLQRRLDESDRIIKDAEAYLTSTVNGFNGTVKVLQSDGLTPAVDVTGSVVYADWVSLTAMATMYRNDAQKLNASGHSSYKNITSSYETIKLANETAALAARQISDAMARLSQVSAQRADVERRLGPSFQAELQNNSALLDEIKRISEEIDNLLKSAISMGNRATASGREAETIVNTANSTAHQRKAEAEKALVDAQNALTTANKSRAVASNAQRVATQFKTNASTILDHAKNALKNVTDGINDVAKAINKSRDSQTIADRVIGMKLPVTLATIKSLTTEIKAIPVDDALINKTYEGAAEGLKKAKEVEELSKKAIDVAQTTLREVESIEKAVANAKTLRTETENLQQQTDEKVTQINNITQSIQTRFENASLIGEDTLRLINKTISTVDQSLQCFNESKKTAEAAVVTAEKAYNLTRDAEKVNGTVSADIERISNGEVNPLYATAQANYTSIKHAYNDSVQLLKDVNEAEVLLNEYVQQRQEMEALKSETEGLENELDTLIREFDEDTKKYSKCGGS